MEFLLSRWEQVQEGRGQVVLLSGEAGIGKSRLVRMLQAHVASAPAAWLTPCQCLAHYQNSTLYPIIDLLERVVLTLTREESPQQKLRKLEGWLVQYGFSLPAAVPLFASLLSLPLGAGYTPLDVTPAQHKHQTLQAILTALLQRAAQQPVLFAMEDLHWADASTLELLHLLVDQVPTAQVLVLLTFRPEFTPSWGARSHVAQVTLTRLSQQQTEAMIARLTQGKALPAEVHRATGAEDRWRTPVRRRVDQDGAGVRVAQRTGGTLRADWPAASAGDSHDAARLPDGAGR